jgi:hypothetical protein
MRPNPQWTLGVFQNRHSPALSPRLLWVDSIPTLRCNLRSLISWFQLFGALVYVEHGGSTAGTAFIEYADPLGAWRAMICEFPAWGDMTVSAKYASLMEVKGYGKGREMGRTTVPLTGIQAGTSASDSMKGNRGVKRNKEETEIEDRELDFHLGVPVPPPKAPIAGPSRPAIMTRRWLTKVIDGQEYIIVDGDENDPDVLVHEALPIQVATQFAPRRKKSRRRRPQRALSRDKAIKREPVEIDGWRRNVEMETSEREDEAGVESILQDDAVDGYNGLQSTEDEDYDSEASMVEIPQPELSTMVLPHKGERESGLSLEPTVRVPNLLQHVLTRKPSSRHPLDKGHELAMLANEVSSLRSRGANNVSCESHVPFIVHEVKDPVERIGGWTFWTEHHYTLTYVM